MPGRILWQGQPWEDLFDADVIGDGPQAHSFTDDGVPMKFAHIQHGTKRPDIGFTVRIGGVDVDVTTLWAQKGSAVYINTAAVPADLIVVNEGSTPPVTATVSMAFNRNGTVTFVNGGAATANFILNPTSTSGDAYRVRFRLISKSTAGTLSGTLDTWLQISESRSIALSVTVPNAVFVTAWANLQIDIQRISDGATVHTYAVRMEAGAGIT
ncbi:hypothetical protein [Lysobacter brunescens]|uniref:Minor tail protein n=1 Tax=Lysobacter brunescens TaxID=262323 RepID=A0ABW2YF15_9GAMM